MSTEAVDNVAANLATTSISDDAGAKAAAHDAVLASAAEGRRLYIGNLAYATTEDQLKEFFKGYLVYVTPLLVNSFLISGYHSALSFGLASDSPDLCRLMSKCLALFYCIV
jgi:RNA recognition motif. (a.k.a. RRM, RBD, or RNP domain)